MFKKTFTLFVTLIFFLYPIGIYFGLKYFSGFWLGVVLVFLLLLRFIFFSDKNTRTTNAAMLFAGFFCFLLMLFHPSNFGIKLYPALVSFIFLSVFMWSLFYPPSMIERFARRFDSSFDDSGIKYTKKVTIVWCAFFIFNACFSIYTSLYSSDEFWTLYHGLISYLLIGCLIVGEWFFRRLIKRRFTSD